MALADRCPQVGSITFLFKRTPEFNTINRLLDPDSWHYVACSDGKVVGVVGVMYFNAQVQGRICKVAYILDLLLDEKYRSGMTAYRMIKPVVERLYESDAELVLVNFLKDNQHPIVFAKGRAGFPAAAPLGDNRFFSMLSLYRMKLRGDFEIASPTMADIDELVELYNRCGRSYKLAEIVTRDQLIHYLTNVEGLSLDRFLVARQNGSIKAVTAQWDEQHYKHYLVQRLSFGLSLVSNLLSFMSMFMRVPQPVRLNQPLKQLSLVMSAHDNCPQALEELFKHVNNQNRGSDYTLITLHAQQHDPIMEIMGKFRGISVQSEMWAFAREPGILEQLRDNTAPVMFNLALLL